MNLSLIQSLRIKTSHTNSHTRHRNRRRQQNRINSRRINQRHRQSNQSNMTHKHQVRNTTIQTHTIPSQTMRTLRSHERLNFSILRQRTLNVSTIVTHQTMPLRHVRLTKATLTLSRRTSKTHRPLQQIQSPKQRMMRLTNTSQRITQTTILRRTRRRLTLSLRRRLQTLLSIPINTLIQPTSSRRSRVTISSTPITSQQLRRLTILISPIIRQGDQKPERKSCYRGEQSLVLTTSNQDSDPPVTSVPRLLTTPPNHILRLSTRHRT